MAKFEEEKVINALHPEKAKVGKKYWYSDNLLELRRYVEENNADIGELSKVEKTEHDCVFHFVRGSVWQFLYPYEEPPKQRMTNRQLAEWGAKGNGELTTNTYTHIYVYHHYHKVDENKETEEDILIRPFGQTEWIEPTVDIYERDCKGGKK